jgi:hypothetical protein
MKKLLRISIILIICLVSLTGCGNHDETTSKAEPATKAAVAVTSNSSIAVTEPGIAENTATDASKNTENKDTAGKLDKYQTAPVPVGKPDPVEPQNADINKKTEYHCTLSITCNTILDNMDKFDQAKLEVLPKDGVIYKTKEVVFYEGESVFDVLLRETRDNKIHMEFVDTPIYNSNYIEGINNIYEFDCGELSGWMYKVNDWFPNYGCSRYQLKDRDKIEWVYTCGLGKDVGGDWKAQMSEDEQQEEQ